MKRKKQSKYFNVILVSMSNCYKLENFNVWYSGRLTLIRPYSK